MLYPAHKVRIPGFLHKEHQEEWVRVIGTRALPLKEDRTYVPLHLSGQSFVFRNVRCVWWLVYG